MKLDGVIGTPHERQGICAVMLEGSHLVFAGQAMLKHTGRRIEGKHKYSRTRTHYVQRIRARITHLKNYNQYKQLKMTGKMAKEMQLVNWEMQAETRT